MCYNPIVVKVTSKSGTVSYKEVPCGKCLECLKAYQRSWTIRQEVEFKAFNRVATMVTLTYAEDAVPKNYLWRGKVYKSKPLYNYSNDAQRENLRGGRLVKKSLPYTPVYDYNKETGERFLKYGLPEDAPVNDIVPLTWVKKNVQLDSTVVEALKNDKPISFNSVRREDLKFFLDRFRRGVDKKFSIFLTSEYGPSTYRPHYHAIFFGLTPRDLQPLITEWKRTMGQQVVVEQVNDNGSFAYVGKYCSKGSFENPLCAKDFFYPQEDGSFKEFHSKDYEYCIKFFDVNESLCDRTFHIISKGLGSSYINTQTCRFHNAYNTDTRKYDLNKIIRNRYYTNEKGQKFSLPKYYYEKIVSSSVRAQVSNLLLQRDVALFNEELLIVEAENIYRTPAEMELEVLRRREHNRDYKVRQKRCFEQFNNKYKKSKI